MFLLVFVLLILRYSCMLFFFFFQAEDGIRDWSVTGVQTCALLIHGAAESSKAWFAWVPHLARTFRVLRPDQRGFGQSKLSSEAFVWSPASLAADMSRFLDVLNVRSAHVVGAKIGGTVAMQFAADYP